MAKVICVGCEIMTRLQPFGVKFKMSVFSLLMTPSGGKSLWVHKKYYRKKKLYLGCALLTSLSFPTILAWQRLLEIWLSRRTGEGSQKMKTLQW